MPPTAPSTPSRGRGAVLRDRQLARLCDALAAVPSDAPTCCEGWTAYHLAAHIWQLHREPLRLAACMALGRPDAGLPRLIAGGDYDALVAELRHLTGPIRAMPGDAFEGCRHSLGEYVVHTHDLVHANDLPAAPVEPELAEALWLRAGVAARALHGLRREGFVLEHPDGRMHRIGLRQRRRIIGAPEQLLFWVHGRPATIAESPL